MPKKGGKKGKEKKEKEPEDPDAEKKAIEATFARIRLRLGLPSSPDQAFQEGGSPGKEGGNETFATQ